jgi:hypothetical protein
LTDEADSNKVLAILNEEYEVLKKNGDLKSNILADGSDNEEYEEQLGQCCGFGKVEDTKACNTSTDGLLWIETSKGSKSFCKATHMLCYVAKYHLGQGKKAELKKRKLADTKGDESSEPGNSRKE